MSGGGLGGRSHVRHLHGFGRWVCVCLCLSACPSVSQSVCLFVSLSVACVLPRNCACTRFKRLCDILRKNFTERWAGLGKHGVNT